MAKDGSLDAVTEFLVKQRTGADDTPAPEPAAEPVAEAPAPAESDVTDEVVEDADDAVEEELDASPKPAEDGDDDGEEPDEPEVEYLDLKEDDLIEVTVDGESREVTLQDLKNAYGGEGAIDKRFEEATNSRKAALAEREEVAKAGETAHQAMLSVVKQLDDILHTPTVAPPAEQLKQTNPGAYLKQLDAYQAEQQALGQSRHNLVESLKAHSAEVEKQREAQRTAELQLLQQNFAPLKSKNPKTRKQASQDILDAVEEFGFSPEDMKNVVDHRIYMMAWEAMQYRKLKKQGKQTQLGELQEKASRKKRVLRSVNPSSRKTRASRKQREAKAVANRAKETGKVDDVASFMLHQHRNRG